MRRMLVTGGTVFVSRFMAAYFVAQGWAVYVLNRNTRQQVAGVHLIQADRHALGDQLRGLHFDAVIDNGYTPEDVAVLLDALGSFDRYVFISSSAVYPEHTPQPFREDAPVGPNTLWGTYGTDKIAAEQLLQRRVPGAYILRPPYLYGPMNNLYREAFVFDCALADRVFYLPEEGGMPLQFFHIRDLCRFVERLLEVRPEQRIYNVGNPGPVSVREWVCECYKAAGKEAVFRRLPAETDARSCFCFRNYAYCLDVTAQGELLKELTPLSSGLREAFAWYGQHSEEVRKKPFLAFLDSLQ